MAYTSAYTEHYHHQEKAGQAYDRSLANRFELAIQELEEDTLVALFRRCFQADPNTRYLDFACGTGRIMGMFKDLIRAKVGVDTSPWQLAIARQKVPDAELFLGNVVTDPDLLGGRQFDLITSFRLLLNLEPEYRVPILSSLRERLTLDGYLIVDNHMNRYSVLGVLAFLAHRVLGIPRKPLVPRGRRGIISTMSESEVRDAISAAGLQVVEVHRISVLPGHGSLLLLPFVCLVRLEALLRRMPVINRLSKNQIYVCRRLGPVQA
jgi:SAM-dependent methyltransferase